MIHALMLPSLNKAYLPSLTGALGQELQEAYPMTDAASLARVASLGANEDCVPDGLMAMLAQEPSLGRLHLVASVAATALGQRCGLPKTVVVDSIKQASLTADVVLDRDAIAILCTVLLRDGVVTADDLTASMQEREFEYHYLAWMEDRIYQRVGEALSPLLERFGKNWETVERSQAPDLVVMSFEGDLYLRCADNGPAEWNLYYPTSQSSDDIELRDLLDSVLAAMSLFDLDFSAPDDVIGRHCLDDDYHQLQQALGSQFSETAIVAHIHELVRQTMQKENVEESEAMAIVEDEFFSLANTLYSHTGTLEKWATAIVMHHDNLTNQGHALRQAVQYTSDRRQAAAQWCRTRLDAASQRPSQQASHPATLMTLDRIVTWMETTTPRDREYLEYENTMEQPHWADYVVLQYGADPVRGEIECHMADGLLEDSMQTGVSPLTAYLDPKSEFCELRSFLIRLTLDCVTRAMLSALEAARKSDGAAERESGMQNPETP
tara:strand:+ start:3396 stop:4877 length:1482 start_codon:yes stop_codon:yes gene_type:complete